MVVHDRDRAGTVRIRCATARDAGACAHRRLYAVAAIERLVLDGMRAELRAPQRLAVYARAYAEERRRLAAREAGGRAAKERRLAELTRRMDRIVDAIADGSLERAEAARRAAAVREERVRLEAELRALPPPKVVALHPAALDRALKQLDGLAAELGGDAGDASLAAAFRALVETVVVHPTAPRAPLDIEVTGWLGALLDAPQLPPAGRYDGIMTVAEARCRHHPTQPRWGLRLAG